MDIIVMHHILLNLSMTWLCNFHYKANDSFCKTFFIQSFNTCDAENRIFRLPGSIPYLLMPWVLKSPEHQPAWSFFSRQHVLLFIVLYFHTSEITCKCHLQNVNHFVEVSTCQLLYRVSVGCDMGKINKLKYAAKFRQFLLTMTYYSFVLMPAHSYSSYIALWQCRSMSMSVSWFSFDLSGYACQ